MTYSEQYCPCGLLAEFKYRIYVLKKLQTFGGLPSLAGWAALYCVCDLQYVAQREASNAPTVKIVAPMYCSGISRILWQIVKYFLPYCNPAYHTEH
jgi:hypothetical protein